MICFLSEFDVPNYLDSPEIYSTFSLGKISHCAYYYWILKNHGVSNIKLITDINKIESGDVVFFYQADREKNPLPYTTLNKFGSSITKIQVVGDTNLKEEADFYAINDPSKVDDRKFYLPFPMPVGMIKSIPEFPPKIFGCASHSFNLHPDFYKKKYIREFEKANIELYIENSINRINKRIDVHFFIRNPYIELIFNDDGTKKHPISGYKHPNRLYQSWYMGVPSIFNTNSPMESIRTSKFDYLEANSVDEFIQNALLLKSDFELFKCMIDVSHKRENENSYEVIVETLKKEIQSKLGFQLI